ncbi:MAG: GPW/gp25 family protein [Chitinivibrionales bacterium]|nr:GPW/gp25 family protein [Chitinivibrionales bacterium]
MNIQRFCAWRFDCIQNAGINPQGLTLSNRGEIEMISDEESIRQSIMILLSTVPGERLMHPEYGCDLSRILFNPNDDTTAGLALYYVKKALQRYETRIEILRIDARINQERSEQLDIVLDYRIVATQQQQRIAFPITLY